MAVLEAGLGLIIIIGRVIYIFIVSRDIALRREDGNGGGWWRWRRGRERIGKHGGR